MNEPVPFQRLFYHSEPQDGTHFTSIETGNYLWLLIDFWNLEHFVKFNRARNKLIDNFCSCFHNYSDQITSGNCYWLLTSKDNDKPLLWASLNYRLGPIKQGHLLLRQENPIAILEHRKHVHFLISTLLIYPGCDSLKIIPQHASDLEALESFLDPSYKTNIYIPTGSLVKSLSSATIFCIDHYSWWNQQDALADKKSLRHLEGRIDRELRKKRKTCCKSRYKSY